MDLYNLMIEGLIKLLWIRQIYGLIYHLVFAHALMLSG